MAKVLCTCGCGRSVSRSTKQNHIKGRGTTALRATVLAETELLKIPAGQPQELQKKRGSKNRTSFNPDEGSSHKRLKVSRLDARPETDKSSIFPMHELEASPLPEVPSTHPDPDPLPAAVIQSNRFVERTRHAIEQCWGGRRDNEDENGGGGKVEDNDEDEDKDDDDNEDYDNEDNDGDNDEDNEDEDIETVNKILGTWDLLGEDFECEAAALG